MWFLGYIASFVISLWLVRYYAERNTHWGILFIVAFSWSLGFSYFLVLPFDIVGAMCHSCHSGSSSCLCYPAVGLELLADLVPLCYAVTMLCGYLMNDLLRSFLESGEFNSRGRLRDAAKDAAIFYIPALIIGIVLLVYMIASVGVSFDIVRALLRGIVNAIGLFLLIAFLGYGFVEVPRHLLNKANTDGQLRYAKFRVAIQSEALQNARRKLEETLELVHSTDGQLRTMPHSALHTYMAAILRRCPRPSPQHGAQQMRAANSGASGGTISNPPTPPDAESGGGAASLSSVNGGGGGGNGGGGRFGIFKGRATVADEKLLPTTRKGLVTLHLRLKTSLANEKRQRSMYELEVRRALKLQALFEPAPSATSSTGVRGLGTPVARLESSPGLDRTSGAASSLPPAQQRWHGTIKPWLYRIAAVVCATLSVILIWCEGTILFDGEPFHTNLSIVSLFFRSLGAGGGNAGVIILLYVPLVYCAACTYFAFFQMKLCESVALHPQQHTDASALLFNATYACRLGPALCFNFLKLLHERDEYGLFVHQTSPPITTFFTQTSFGDMDQIPLFSGDYFNNFAPLLIVVISGCTMLNLGSGLLSCCAKCCPCVAAPAFSFDEDFSDTRIDHGATILLRERNALADGVPLGSNLQLLSGATSDSEEPRLRGAASRNTPAHSNFNRLRDEASFRNERL